MRLTNCLAGGVIALSAACSPLAPAGTETDSPLASVSGGSSNIGPGQPLDLSGAWTWSREEHLTIPDWVAMFVIGIQPEGPVTQARCEGSGTMTLEQTGATFTGTATESSHQCVTSGGQAFQAPGFADPILIADGRIHGRSIRFSFSSPTVTPCPHHAVISAVDNGLALALDGTGQCFVPGHPKSESPIALPPPPGGTSKTLTSRATRS